MYDEKKEWDNVRIRNLRISIARGLKAEEWGNDRSFSESELKQVFRFKASDLVYYADIFFERSAEMYILSEKEKKYTDRILHANRIAMDFLRDADAKFVAEFGSFHDEYENDSYGDFSYIRYQEVEESVAELLPVLHWGHLPIFDKYLLYNRGINPEQKTVEFYDHYDCLKALLDEIRGKGQSMQIKSDETLEKDLMFEVYTRRWGHKDRYRMRRTIDGWHCSHIAINGKCEKNGEGALFANLQHDCVFFPEDGVKHGMEELWEAADEGEIDLEELQGRLQQMADWISHVEKAVGAGQPEWVNYY